MQTVSTGFYKVAESLTPAERRRRQKDLIDAVQVPVEKQLRGAEKDLSAFLRRNGAQVKLSCERAPAGWEKMAFGAVKLPAQHPPALDDAVVALLSIHVIRRALEAGQMSVIIRSAIDLGRAVERMNIRPIETRQRTRNSKGGARSTAIRQKKANERDKQICEAYAAEKRRHQATGVSESYIVGSVADLLGTSETSVRRALKKRTKCRAL